MANNYFAYLVGKITKSPLSERDTDLVLTYLTNCIERYDVITAKHSEIEENNPGILVDTETGDLKRDQSNEVEALLYATNSEISQIVGGVALYIHLPCRGDYDDEEINGFWRGVYCSYYIVSLAVAHPCPGARQQD